MTNLHKIYGWAGAQTCSPWITDNALLGLAGSSLLTFVVMLHWSILLKTETPNTTDLSVKICTDQSNKVKTLDIQMHVRFVTIVF